MKAVSPMIAVVLLIAFTVAVGGILSVWLTGLSATTTGVAGSATEKQTKCAISLRIPEVTYALGASVDQLNVTVEYIYGSEDLYFFNFTIIDDIKSSVTTSPVAGENYNKTTPFKPGNVRVFNLTITDSIRVLVPQSLPGTKVDTVIATAKCQDTVTVSAECKSGSPCLKAS